MSESTDQPSDVQDLPGSSQDGKSSPKSGSEHSWIARLRRLLPKLRLRDLLWLSLLSAVLMTWYRDRTALLERVQTSPNNIGNSWSIRQLLGRPDTPGPGDQSTAWASASQDGQKEWLVVEFPTAIRLAKVEIVETYNPGAVSKIASVDMSGREKVIWTGKDPTPTSAAMGRSLISIKNSVRTRRIKIFIDSDKVPGWNEVDAVAIHDKDGKIQWASNAWASTCFGENQPLPRWFWP